MDFTLSIPLNFSFNCDHLLHPHQEMAIASTSPVSFVEVSTISEWIRKYNDVFERFQRITDNGLYSILEKEVQNVTPLLQQGHMISHSLGRFSGITQMINDLVQPRFQQLQHTYLAAQKKLAEHSKEKGEDAKLAHKWIQLGLPVSVLENHGDYVRFLFESHLIFSIIGFRETCGNSHDHDIKLDVDGHPLLKVENRFVRWEAVRREIDYDSQNKKIKSRDYPGNLVQAWSYYHPQGLIPIDPYNNDQIFPIYQLSQKQYQQVRQHALKFYETNRENDIGIPKNCILQFFTSPRQQLPEYWFLQNANRQYPTHVGVRLIDEHGRVFSFGAAIIPEDLAFLFSDLSSNLLTTTEAKILMLDYEEFRAHEGRIVTSIPLTAQRAQNVLNFLHELMGKQLRFQYQRQNCSILMLEILKIAGYTLDIRTDNLTFLYEMLPNLNQIPVIGPLIAKVEKCVDKIWQAIPTFIKTSIQWTKEAVLFFPRKWGLLITNLIAWKLGAGKKTTPLAPDVEEDEFYDKKGFQNFSCILRSWIDFFKEETTAIYNAKYFIDWQKQQHSTFIEPYTGCPKLSIVPPTGVSSS